MTDLIKSQHVFTRGNGERITVELTVDQQALALWLSRRITPHRQAKATAGGACRVRVLA